MKTLETVTSGDYTLSLDVFDVGGPEENYCIIRVTNAARSRDPIHGSLFKLSDLIDEHLSDLPNDVRDDLRTKLEHALIVKLIQTIRE